jgi:hypothetical protein
MSAIPETPPGAWLVARYAPVSLFALKASYATSSVGTTLVTPTPYAVKMALVDAAFRAGRADAECAQLLSALREVEVRLAPPDAVVTHTFAKIRQEPKEQKPDEVYISSIAYRELASQHGELHWALGVAPDTPLAAELEALLPLVRYIGKRGGFIQFLGAEWRHGRLGPRFTAPVHQGELPVPARSHVVPLDDFGPEASLEVLSSFSEKPAKRDRHRRFVETVVPLGRVRAGAGFTEYRQ